MSRGRELVHKEVPCEGDNSIDTNDITSCSTDDDFIPNPRALTDGILQNRTRLLTLPATCDRYLIGVYVGAAIATATLIDYGIITKNDNTQIVIKYKMRDRNTDWRDKKLK